jgi:hypothetical protein
MTSPTRRAPDARRTPCRTGGPRPQAPACCHAHHDRAGCVYSIRSSCPGSVAADAGPRLRDHDHEPEREAPGPIDDRVQQVINGRQRPKRGRCLEASLLATARHPVLRVSTPTVLHGSVADAAAPALTAPGRGAAAREPRPSSVRPRIIAAGTPAVAGVPAPVKTSPAGRIRQGPSMYEMEGPCPASPHQAGQLAGLPVPRAARRCQVPARGAGRPAPPTFPGRPGWCPFPTVKAFLQPPRTPRKALRSIISGHFRYPRGIHRTRAVIRVWRRLSTGLFTARPQAAGVTQGTPGPPSPHVIG